jgi:hypothetical protein
MKSWPWTNTLAIIKERLNLSKQEDFKTTRIVDIDDFFDSIKNRKVPFWEKIWNPIRFRTNDLVWDVYRFFNPCHKRLRKVIPRRWCDLTELTLLINFEIIKSFVEEEMHIIDWNSNDSHKEVAAWLNSSYKYITEERIQLQEEFDIALTDSSDNKRGQPYAERYAEPNRIEALIDKRDTEILIGLATHRQYLWS